MNGYSWQRSALEKVESATRGRFPIGGAPGWLVHCGFDEPVFVNALAASVEPLKSIINDKMRESPGSSAS